MPLNSIIGNCFCFLSLFPNLYFFFATLFFLLLSFVTPSKSSNFCHFFFNHHHHCILLNLRHFFFVCSIGLKGVLLMVNNKSTPPILYRLTLYFYIFYNDIKFLSICYLSSFFSFLIVIITNCSKIVCMYNVYVCI